jgi:hypothetical protein
VLLPALLLPGLQMSLRGFSDLISCLLPLLPVNWLALVP